MPQAQIAWCQQWLTPSPPPRPAQRPSWQGCASSAAWWRVGRLASAWTLLFGLLLSAFRTRLWTLEMQAQESSSKSLRWVLGCLCRAAGWQAPVTSRTEPPKKEVTFGTWETGFAGLQAVRSCAGACCLMMSLQHVPGGLYTLDARPACLCRTAPLLRTVCAGHLPATQLCGFYCCMWTEVEVLGMLKPTSILGIPLLHAHDHSSTALCPSNMC